MANVQMGEGQWGEGANAVDAKWDKSGEETFERGTNDSVVLCILDGMTLFVQINQRHSLQLFVVEFDTCLVWELLLLLLPSKAQTASHLPSLQAPPDGDSSEG